MKASELIKLLEYYKAREGDLEVRCGWEYEADYGQEDIVSTCFDLTSRVRLLPANAPLSFMVIVLGEQL